MKTIAMLKNTLGFFAGKLKYQKVFAQLHKLSLKGMNIGEGASINEDGELRALAHIKEELAEKARGPYVIFDVGANIGDYTKKAITAFRDAETKIFSFEPSQKTFAKLRANVGNEKNVSLYTIAFGEKNSAHTLYSDKEGSGLASIYKRRLDHFNLTMDTQEEITVKTLDDFCREYDIQHIHFLKMDIEGHEFFALRGAQNMMRSDSIDFIQFEFGGCNIDSRTYFQDFFYLLAPKYDLFRIVKDGLFPITRYDETHEIFITTNFLARRKDFKKVL